MPRRQRASDLPPLLQTCPLDRSTTPVNQTAFVEAELRRVALRYRGDKRLRFYTMSEVAAHFQFSKASAFHVYRRLQAEGLIKVLRGAQTWLLPLPAKRKANLRGILALAAWVPGLSQFPDWRVFLRQFELSALKHQIACYPLLYEHQEDANREEYLNRIRQYQPDWFAWLYPPRNQREIFLKLHDLGISPFIITPSARTFTDFSPYYIDLSKPMVSLLQTWKSHGIKVANIYADGAEFPIDGEWKYWVEAAGLEFRFTDLNGGIFPEAPSGRLTEGIILPETYGTSLLMQRWKHHPSHWEHQHILLATRLDLREVINFGHPKHLYGILPDWAKAADIVLDAITDPTKKPSGYPTALPARMFHAKSFMDFDVHITRDVS